MDTVHTYVVGKEDDIKKVLNLCLSRGGAQLQNTQSTALYGSDPDGAANARREELFNISVSLYQDNREYVIGNSHLPIEDLVETIMHHEQRQGSYNKESKKATLGRTLFLYGTTYSQRENCIIGKMQIEVQYSQEKLYLGKKEAIAYKRDLIARKAKGETPEQPSSNPNTCFMHRETYINRKIPLNAKLSILIDRVQNLKESIENIEHFAKIQHSAAPDISDEVVYSESLRSLGQTTMVHNQHNMQHLDRRRVLKHILKNGLNLIIMCSMFEEDQELSKKFDLATGEEFQQEGSNPLQTLNNVSKYQTRMLFNSLNPVFGEVFEMNVQMDTKIFEYLKNKRAVFEVRHYILESERQKQARRRQWVDDDVNDRDDAESQTTVVEEDVLSQADYIVLGHVRVPLLQLITKNNGVDGDFNIFDEFKQKMGSLKLRITLNHFNSQRPLYQASAKAPELNTPVPLNAIGKQTLIDKSIALASQIKLGSASQVELKRTKFILGLNFIELLLKGRQSLLKQPQGLVQKFFLKFRFSSQNHQTKFLGADSSKVLEPLDLLLLKMNLQKLQIKKSVFVEMDFKDQLAMEEAFGKPLEIQLWHKVESTRSYEKPIKEEMLGQFFVELNELTKLTNRRL